MEGIMEGILNDPKLQADMPRFLELVNYDPKALWELPEFLAAFSAACERQENERKAIEEDMAAFEAANLAAFEAANMGDEDEDEDEDEDDKDGDVVVVVLDHDLNAMIGCPNGEPHDMVVCPHAHSGEQIARCSAFTPLPMAAAAVADKSLICKDCSKNFNFTAKEQKEFAESKFADPCRCENCRKAKKAGGAAAAAVAVIADKSLICKDCGKDFNFTAKEQKEFAKSMYADPCRCENCRKVKKAGGAAGGGGGGCSGGK
jgi:hypothetical protein